MNVYYWNVSEWFNQTFVQTKTWKISETIEFNEHYQQINQITMQFDQFWSIWKNMLNIMFEQFHDFWIKIDLFVYFIF